MVLKFKNTVNNHHVNYECWLIGLANCWERFITYPFCYFLATFYTLSTLHLHKYFCCVYPYIIYNGIRISKVWEEFLWLIERPHYCNMSTKCKINSGICIFWVAYFWLTKQYSPVAYINDKVSVRNILQIYISIWRSIVHKQDFVSC